MPKSHLVSVFTPSHRNEFLDECCHSLLAQSYSNWEWIVLLNGGNQWQPPVDDARIRVVDAPRMSGVGALKHFACSLATGEYLVELDHDDLLATSALNEIVTAFSDHPDVGLVFSDFAQINADGSRSEERFNEAMGWTYRDVVVDGQSVLQVDSFEQYPSTVSFIWFAPNHVRAFRHSAYKAVGGYDEAFDILDDQDLMCRLYEYADFYRISKCLYLQRIHEGNTQKDPSTNARIQSMTIALYDRYLERNALAWAKRRGLMALNLDAARNKPNGYQCVDAIPGEMVDIVGDIARGLDLPDSSVGVIRAVDFLPRVADQVILFNEIYRLLAHGGMLLSLTPSTDGRGAFQNPSYVSYYNENTFWYFTSSSFAANVPELNCRFQVSRLVTYFPDEWHQRNAISYVNSNLVAIKDGPRIAGELLT